jgi:Zn-dependent protease with chaperone function
VVATATEPQEELDAVRTNQRKARRLAVLPGLVLGVVVGVVLAAIGLPVEGLVALVVLAAVVTLAVDRSAANSIPRAVGAHPSVEADRPRLHNLVDGLCATMGLPRPEILVVESDVPNALAAGRSPGQALLIVTTALEPALSVVELEGVLAHELVHVKRYDTLLAGVAVTLAGPYAALRGTDRAVALVHDLVGHGREFSADQRAAAVVRYPRGIGAALGSFAEVPPGSRPWPPGGSRAAQLTRWLWIDPMAAGTPMESMEGNLDDTRVRAAALALD